MPDVNLSVEPVTPDTRAAVLALAVPPEHVAFSGLPSQTLPRTETDPCRLPMAVLESGRVVGFFVLCWGEEIAHFASGPNTLGVRAFLIDASEQGKGYGTAIFGVLNDFLLEHRPTCTELNLTVNAKNPRAHRAYLRAGFVEAAELYLGGPSGPQHVMSRPIRRA
jgi:RimJ/RimL family protein N-acetyltransferase